MDTQYLDFGYLDFEFNLIFGVLIPGYHCKTVNKITPLLPYAYETQPLPVQIQGKLITGFGDLLISTADRPTKTAR